jgi:ankyrin repeat protein
MDSLNAAKTMLEARLKAAEAVLAEERCERDKDKALHAQVEERIKASEEGGGPKLLKAARSGDEATIRSLLSFINLINENLFTPLDLAVENDKEEAETVLRAHGALHSLHFAAAKGMTDEVAVDIAAGQDVNARDQASRTPLDLAVEYDKEEEEAVLRAHGALHSLHFAVRKRMPDQVAAGIAAGQDVNARDESLCTPLDRAVENCTEEWAVSRGTAVMRAHGALHSLHFAAGKGMTDEVAAGIAAGQDVNARDQSLITPLDLAVGKKKEETAPVMRAHGALHSLHFEAKEGMTDEVTARIAAGQDVNAHKCYGKTALHLAAKEGASGVAETLLKAGCNKDILDTYYGKSALHFAAENGHGCVTEPLLKAGCNKDIQDTSLRTPLDLAVGKKKEAVVAVLRAHGAMHSFHFVAEEGMTDEVTARIAAGQDVNVMGAWNICYGQSAPLHLATKKGASGVAEALLKAGCNKDILDTYHGKSALHLAAENGHGCVTEALLKAGCNPHIQDTYGMTALHWAVCKGHVGVAETLLKAGCNPDIQIKMGKTALHETASKGDGGLEEALLKAGCSPHIQNTYGETALHLAASTGHGGIAEALLKAGCIPDIQTSVNCGRTALHLAAANGHGGVVETLLKAGCNKDIQDTYYGQTALHLAASKGHGGVAEALLKAGCNPHIQDTYGRTALHLAAKNGHGGIAEALLKAGCNPHIQDTIATNQPMREYDRTALHLAAKNGHGGIVEALLKAGCNPHIQDTRLRTPLDQAVGKKKEEAAAVLRAHGALHSLHFAAEEGMTDEVTARIASCQDVNARNKYYGQTAMHLATFKGNGGVAEALLKAGCSPHIQDKYGRTALHLAAHLAAGFGHGGIAEALLKADCKPHIQDDCGMTALHWEVLKGNGGVAEALLKAGCNPHIQ